MKHTHDNEWRRRRVAAPLFLLATFLLLVSVAPAVAAPPVSSVSDQLMCQCGCNSVLTECPHQDCGWGIPAKEYIRQELETGVAPESVVDYFVAQNGEQVLAAPTKSGFNLIAWVLPFVALAVGGVAVYLLVVRWVRGSGSDDLQPVEVPSGRDATSETARRLEEELRDFD